MKDLNKLIRIDKAYLVSLKELEGILAKIKGKHGREFFIEKANDTHITIYTKDKNEISNEFSFSFPVVESLVSLPPIGDDKLICIHPLTAQQVRKGLYFNSQGELLGDYFEDFEQFWGPLVKILEKTFKESEKELS